MIAFLEKPVESDGLHKIVDFLNANQIHYALTVNPTIYTSCIKQFWAIAKVKRINGERQLQALVDEKKVIITETSIRSDLHLEDAGGTDCLPTATIFEELARMRNEPEVSQDETQPDDSVLIPSNDLLLNEEGPKVRKEKKSRTTGLKRLRKVSESRIIESSEDKDDDAEMFDTYDLHDDEVVVDMAVGEKQQQSAKVDEREVSTGVEDSASKIPTTTIDEMTLAQTLIEIKAAKPKSIPTAATTTTTIRPKAR
ncbi:hypothetical protein Tco_1158489 [Tanacetum coccineum]